jgi:hypothetical protein
MQRRTVCVLANSPKIKQYMKGKVSCYIHGWQNSTPADLVPEWWIRSLIHTFQLSQTIHEYGKFHANILDQLIVTF